MTCYRHRFHNQFEASSWGLPYQCPKCGWWHIRFINWKDITCPWPADKVIFWGAITLCCGYFWWIVINAFVAWNWPG